MRHLMLFCAAIALAQAADPAPAFIINNDNSQTRVFVREETITGVDFLLPDPVRGAPDPNASSSKPRGQYKRINYDEVKTSIANADFNIADEFFKKGEVVRALDFYRRAIDKATFQWVIERSYVRAIECLVDPKVNQPDEGLKLVETFLGKYPKSIHIGSVTALRADLRLAKGDLPGAEQDYREVVKNGELWGFPASRGQLGLAETLKRAKKFPEAVQLLAAAFAAAKDAAGFSSLGLGLAEMQLAASQKDDAAKTLRRVALGPGDATPRGEAHLRLARLLAEGASGKALAVAFDHAVLAARVSNDDAVVQAANALARELAGRIDKDKSFSDEDRKEYKDYSRNL